MNTIICEDTSRTLPLEWDDQSIRALFDHARDLGHNGNPGGYLFTVRVARYVASSNQYGRFLRNRDKWDYAGLRRFIAEHPDEVRRIWQSCVRTF